MKISTKGRYALRLMTDLALNSQEEFVTLKSIAQRQGISDKYLEQIVHKLAKAGFVKSFRGASGGYRLLLPPEQYTVGAILRVVEGSLAPVECVECDTVCSRQQICPTINVYRRILAAVNDVVDHITLADIVADYQKDV